MLEYLCLNWIRLFHRQGRILGGGGDWAMAPPFGSPGLQNCIKKWAKLRHAPPPPSFVSWASGFWLEVWVILGEKRDEIWVKTFFLSFALHLILGEKWDEIWVWLFQILIYVPLKFYEVSGLPLFKILRTLLFTEIFNFDNKTRMRNIPRRIFHLLFLESRLRFKFELGLNLGLFSRVRIWIIFELKFIKKIR